jgi:tRNA nucleotidyltransferase/poly(A) polymerase
MTLDELKILSVLSPAGGLWLVGGFLRDALLNRSLADVDLAVKGDSLSLARKFAAKIKAKAFPLDEERGVYRVVAAGKTFDFAALQGGSIEKDLARRDFTVNAMALPLEAYPASGLKKGLLDPFGGLKDLKARKIRLVAEKALPDDPLRLLRAVRLSAELDFSLESKTAASLQKHAKRILKVSPERVRDELMKTLVTPRGADAFRFLDKVGILTLLLPEAESMRATGHDYYGKEGVLGHSLDAMESFEKVMAGLAWLFPKFHKPLDEHLREPLSGYPRYALLKLGELLHDVGKPATAKKGEDGRLHFYSHEHAGADAARRFGKAWRLSGVEAKSLTRLVRGHMRPGSLGNAPSLTDKAIYRFYRDLEEDAVGLLVMALGDHFTYISDKVQRGRKDPVYLAMRRMLESYFLHRAAVEPPKVVDGHQIMRLLKIKPGPRVGEILETIREAQAAGKVKTKEEALTLAKTLV